jgi:hypothetical protein
MKKVICAVIVLVAAIPASGAVDVSLLIQQQEILPAMPVAFSVTIQSDRAIDLPAHILFLGSKADEPSNEFLLDAVPSTSGPSFASVLEKDRHLAAGEKRAIVFDGDFGDVYFNDARLFFTGEYLVRVVLADGLPVLPLTEEPTLVSQRVPFNVTLPSKADQAVWEWMLERNGGRGWNGLNFLMREAELATYVFHHQRESNFLPYIIMSLPLEDRDRGALPSLIEEATKKFPSSPHLDVLKINAARWLEYEAMYYASRDSERAAASADRAKLWSQDVALHGRTSQLRERGRQLAAEIEHNPAFLGRSKGTGSH